MTATLPAVSALTVHPLTDWHVGAGHGEPGGVDATIRRDHDGLPYVPGTTLTGLLRDACCTVAEALDDGVPYGVWQAWQRVAFGAAGAAPALVGIGPARYSPELRARLSEDPALAAAATTVRPGVKIDRQTGRAADDMLRFVENARGGIPLHAELALEDVLTGDGRRAVSALLVLGAAWCDRMGGDRRRGPGEIRLTLSGQHAADWARMVRDEDWTPEPPPSRPSRTPPRARPEPTADRQAMGSGAWRAFDVEIVTERPVRVPSTVAGNVVRGLDHLPGSMLLPWLSERLGADLIRDAIAAEALLVRHANPDVAGERGVPVPLVLFRAKGSGDGLDTVSVTEPSPGERLIRDSWTVAGTAAPLPLQARSTEQASHNQVDRGAQRPTSETGVFELEVIPAGRKLRGTILLAAGVVDRLLGERGPGWLDALQGPARFGARRHGEYGACQVAVTDGTLPDVGPPPRAFTIWACSDVLVRSPGLRLSADPQDLCRAVAQELGAQVLLISASSRTGRRDGWQGTWNLPRESLVGLGAGTVAHFTVPDDEQIDPDRWRDLIVRGIGERRVEGLGEIVVLAPLLDLISTSTIRTTPATFVRPLETSPTGDDDPGLALLRRIAERDRIQLAVTERRSQFTGLLTVLRPLSRSQRSTWRAVTADAAAKAVTDRTAARARVLAHAERWLANQADKRSAQRAAASEIIRLIGAADLAAQLDLPRLDDPVYAVAALVADAVDEVAHDTKAHA